MKEIFIIHLAVMTKQQGALNFAESVSLAIEGRVDAELLADRLNDLNDSYAKLYDGIEPITLMSTPIGVLGSLDELAKHVEDIIQNGEKRFAEQTGQVIPDTDSELERIRKGTKT